MLTSLLAARSKIGVSLAFHIVFSSVDREAEACPNPLPFRLAAFCSGKHNLPPGVIHIVHQQPTIPTSENVQVIIASYMQSLRETERRFRKAHYHDWQTC